MKLYLPFAFILGMIATLGCGSDAPKGPEKLSTTPVDGIVTLKGLPAAEVSISLHHSEGKVAPRGISDKDGKFSIATYGKDDGAPAITNLMNSIGSAKSNLASAGTFYGGHKGKATEELDKAIKMINIYVPQTKNSTAMGTGKESTSQSQSQSIDTNASNKKLRQAKQAIDNSIGIMYATKNPSFENQLLVSYFKKASKEIDLALKY